MPCSRIKLPDGTVAIVKHAKGWAPRCRFCPERSIRLCDFALARTLAGAEITCDAPVCGSCSVTVGQDRHYCVKHSG
jgi:hypothetical protein